MSKDPDNQAPFQTEREEIWRVFRQFVEGMVITGKIGQSLDVVAEDVMGIGMGEQGVYFNRDGFLGIFNAIVKETAGLTYSVDYGERRIHYFPPGFATVSGEVLVSCEVDGHRAVSRALQMVSMRRENAKWLLCAIACAPLALDAEGIGALPLRFAESTVAQLKSELQKDAVELLNDSIPGGMISFFDRPGYPLNFINHHMLEYLGYSRIEFDARFNRHFLNLVHPDDRSDLARAIERALKSGDEYEFRHRVLRRGGAAAWVIQRGRRTSDRDVLIGVFTDVTEIIDLQDRLQSQAAKLAKSLATQKKQEERLQAVAAAAEEASRMKTTFLANMSHEIRTPMNGVVGFAELALGDTGLSERSREYLNKIKISADGLLGVINDILDISKIESGKMEVELVPFLLEKILRQCESISGVRAEEKGVHLVFEHEGGEAPRLLGDPTKLRQILLNLLSNALKFTDKGTVSLRTALRELAGEEVAVDFVVEDSGIGMERAQLEKIFQPFIQADNSTTRKYGGTGLGLPITKSFVELLGGELRVDSEPGRGSRFSFSLCFEKAGHFTATDTLVLDKSLVFKDKRPVFSGDVLVCEDNEINQEVICGHLARCGLSPEVAANGRAGVEMVARRTTAGNPYALIFMDIHMPVMDGLEATAELRRVGIETPIIALTANVMKQDRARYLQNGLSFCLGKPFVSPELWSCLLKFLAPVQWVVNDASAMVTDDAGGSGDDGDGVIDRRLGMQRAGGGETVYRRVTENFVKAYRNAPAEIEALVAAGDVVEAHRLAHSIKGVAGTLGAIRLFEAARELEASLKDGVGGGCAGPLRMFELELGLVLEELGVAKDGDGGGDEEVVAGVAETIECGAALALLDRLEPLLASGDSRALDLLDEVREVLGGSGALATQIDDYEFEAAAATAAAIRAQFSGA